VSPPVVAFFNVKGGVGRSTLTFHLAWMLADLGFRTLAADLDPQCALTGLFLGTDEAADISARGETLQQGFRASNFAEAPTRLIDENLVLLPGDMGLLHLEPFLWEAWGEAAQGDAPAMAALTRIHCILQGAARKHSCDIILMDLASSMGAINNAAFVAATHLVIPVVPDALAVSGLRMAGQALARWTRDWGERRVHCPPMPGGPLSGPQPLGYVLLKVRTFQGLPIRSVRHWMDEIPRSFHQHVMGGHGEIPRSLSEDPYCLAVLRESHLLSMAAESRKPSFHLSPADGALGGYMSAAQRERQEYKKLASDIVERIGLPPHSPHS
jgi:chromosome partitioning protein